MNAVGAGAGKHNGPLPEFRPLFTSHLLLGRWQRGAELDLKTVKPP